VGVRNNIQVHRRLSVPSTFDGHVVALDILIPSSSKFCSHSALISLYALCDPGISCPLSATSFWPAISTLCGEDAQEITSWISAGDYNLTLSSTERSSGIFATQNWPLRCHAYRRFLTSANWALKTLRLKATLTIPLQ
jgi:hypothetical protein